MTVRSYLPAFPLLWLCPCRTSIAYSSLWSTVSHITFGLTSFHIYKVLPSKQKTTLLASRVTNVSTASALSLLTLDGPRSEQIPVHYHALYHESFFVAKRALQLSVQNETRLLGPLDIASVPVNQTMTTKHGHGQSTTTRIKLPCKDRGCSINVFRSEVICSGTPILFCRWVHLILIPSRVFPAI